MQLFSFLAACALIAAGVFPVKTVVPLKTWLLKCLPIGFASATTLSLGNQAYIYLSVAFIQMLKVRWKIGSLPKYEKLKNDVSLLRKAGTPVITMTTLFAFGMERVRGSLILSVCVIGAGCAIAAWGEVCTVQNNKADVMMFFFPSLKRHMLFRSLSISLGLC